MTATATIRDTTFREGARVAALIVVLMIAAVLGLVVGTALQGQSSTSVGAEAPGAPTLDGTPFYADPHHQLISSAATDDRHFLRRQAAAEQTVVSDNDANMTAPAPR